MRCGWAKKYFNVQIACKCSLIVNMEPGCKLDARFFNVTSFEGLVAQPRELGGGNRPWRAKVDICISYFSM